MPANRSMVGAMTGLLKTSPTYGIDRKNCTMVPKKSPKRPKMPKLSTMNPINERFMRINTMPSPKNTVPLILVGRVKNVTVRWGPMIKINPMTKRMLPKAKSPLSKKVKTPKVKNKNPAAVKPTPNSTVST